MTNFQPYGILLKNNRNEFKFVRIPVEETVDRLAKQPSEFDEDGKIVLQPTPEEVRISKEKKVNHSVNGALRRYKEREGGEDS